MKIKKNREKWREFRKQVKIKEFFFNLIDVSVFIYIWLKKILMMDKKK